MESSPRNLLEVAGLTKRFGARAAVDGLSFALRRGEILGLLGPNGAGKTTTLLCLCGLLRPDSGELRFDGRPLTGERGRSIALIPETPDVFPLLTVWEHLIFVARSADLPAGWEARAKALLARLALTEQRDVLGQALSKGMRQKTLIAATILADAPILLLDEPMVGLDPKGQRDLRELILGLRGAGTAIVMSTHILESAESLCDRAIIMKNGRAIAAGNIADLRTRASGERSLEDAFLEITA
jgi:ABC-type multidrug transport system ATPase subunit